MHATSTARGSGRGTARRRRRWAVIGVVAVLASGLAPAAPAAADTAPELVVNGDFEEPAIAGSFDYLGTISGWSIAPGSVGTVFEVDRGAMGDAYSGAQHVELDSDASTTIVQDVPTVRGARYRLQFAFRPRPGTGEADNVLRVAWGGVHVATLTADSAQRPGWALHTYELLASSTLTRLSFGDGGRSDSFGTLLDAVSVTAADCTSTGSGPWSDPGTWTCRHVPTAQDRVVVRSDDDVVLDVDGRAKDVEVDGLLHATKDLDVKGDWHQTGTFSDGGKTVKLSGCSLQTITGAEATFGTLLVDKAPGCPGVDAIARLKAQLLDVHKGDMEAKDTVLRQLKLGVDGALVAKDGAKQELLHDLDSNGQLDLSKAQLLLSGGTEQKLVSDALLRIGTLAVSKGAGSVTADLPLSVGAMQVLSGSVLAGTKLLDVKDLLIGSGGTLQGGSNTIQISGDFTKHGSFLAGGSLVKLLGSQDQTISGASPITFHTLQVEKTGGTATASTSLGALSTMNVVSGKLQSTAPISTNHVSIFGGGMLGGLGGMNVAGNWTQMGGFIPGPGTVTFNGFGNQSITGTGLGFNSMIVQKPGGLLSAAAPFNIFGGLRLLQGPMLIPDTGIGRGGMTIGPLASLLASPGSTISMAGSWAQHGTFSGPHSTVQFVGPQPAFLTGSRATFGNLLMNKPGSSLTSQVPHLFVTGLGGMLGGLFTSRSTFHDLLIGPEAEFRAGDDGTITITGDLTNNGVFTPLQSTVRFAGDTLQHIGGSAPTTFFNLTVPNTEGLVLNTSVTVQGTLDGRDNLVLGTGDIDVTGVNDPPVVSEIDDQRIDEDATGTASFTIRDVDTPASALRVSATSSNPALLPDDRFSSTDDGHNWQLAFAPLPDRFGQALVTVTVDDGDNVVTRPFTVEVLPVNDAPTVGAGGPYAVDEGSAVSLTAAGADVDGDELAYAWDLDGDGVFEAQGAVVSFHGLDGPSGHPVAVQACDPSGACATSGTTVEVRNVAPTIEGVADDGPVLEGSPVTLTVAASDPAGPADPLDHAFDCDGDGQFEVRPRSAPVGACTFDDDGTFTIRVRVRDDDGGVATAAHQVVVRNAAPVLGDLAGPSGPQPVGTAVPVSGAVTDAGGADTHDCTFAWGDGVQSVLPAADGACSAEHTYAAAGIYTVTVTVTDDDGDSAQRTSADVVVVDPAAGWVTGGGWVDAPAGSDAARPAAAGKTHVNVAARYDGGTPTGQTQVRGPGLELTGDALEWLVVSGDRARYRGTGVLNGVDGHAFTVTVVDGKEAPGKIDTVRVQIWDAAGALVYDNARGAAEDFASAHGQEMGGGNVTVHRRR